MHHVDLAVFAIAEQQFGAFSRRQAMDAGADPALIHRRLASGRWTSPARRVLSLPGHRPSYRRSLWIAILACACRYVVVSHWSGGALHVLPGFPPNRFTLTVPHGFARQNPVATVFQTTAMPTPVLIDGLPVASVERVLVDVARLTGPKKLAALVEEARVAERTSVVRLRREFVRLARSGRDGITSMREVLGEYEEGPDPARRDLEARLDAILATIDVDVRREAPLPGREWSDERVDRRIDEPRRLIVEGDGRRWHTRTRDFRRDRERDRIALRAGYPTLRYAYEDLVEDPGAVRAEILEVLGISEGPDTGFR